MIFVFDRVENIVRIRENASLMLTFSPFTTMPSKAFFLRMF